MDSCETVDVRDRIIEVAVNVVETGLRATGIAERSGSGGCAARQSVLLLSDQGRFAAGDTRVAKEADVAGGGATGVRPPRRSGGAAVRHLDGYRELLLTCEFQVGCPIGNFALELTESHSRVRQLLVENFDNWKNAVRGCLEEASGQDCQSKWHQGPCPLRPDRHGRGRDARTHVSHDRLLRTAINVLRDYFERLQAAARDWGGTPKVRYLPGDPFTPRTTQTWTRRHMMRKTLLGAFLFVARLAAPAGSPEPKLALKGLDPIALIDGKEAPGLPTLEVPHGLFRYQFANAGTRRRSRPSPTIRHSVRWRLRQDGAIQRQGQSESFLRARPPNLRVRIRKLPRQVQEGPRQIHRAAEPGPRRHRRAKAQAALVEKALVGFGGAAGGGIEDFSSDRQACVQARQHGDDATHRVIWSFPDGCASKRSLARRTAMPLMGIRERRSPVPRVGRSM